MNRVFCALAMTTALWVAGAAMAAEKSVTLAIKGPGQSGTPAFEPRPGTLRVFPA